ncbi:hypothetical protein GW846_01465 [Candidatus Gracilibacteria bacterium]|nr:hypothetical protein [Candidatus Gracilibacteria bacterium]
MQNEVPNLPREGELISPGIQDVVLIGEIVKQQINIMGGNDSETNHIDSIVIKARKGTMNLTDAILKLQEIPNLKHGNGGHGLEG